MKAILFFAAALLPASIFALDIYVAPLLYIDETDMSRRSPAAIQRDLLSGLWAVETGTALQFRNLRDNRINPPQSLTDAVTVSRSERIEFLLYGFVIRREHSVQMEIRLFDYVNRRIAQTFFSIDDSNNYERMVNDMALKILAYISETFNLHIIPEKPGTTRLSIPATLGYWTPMESSWTEVMLGTFTLGSGVEFVPTDNLFVYRGKTCYLSTGLEIKYRLGVGNPSKYEAFYHTFYFTIPLRLNFILAAQHEIFTGLGLIYFLQFFSMTEKYAGVQRHVFGNMGMNINFGYRFIFNERYSIFFRNDFDILFNARVLVTYSPTIGLNIQIYEREVKRRW